MLKYNDYVFAESLEQAYSLNQKKNNVVLGGCGWLKMGAKQWNTAIDLSRLGLDKIEEDEEKFTIGSMVTLRQLEKDSAFNAYTQNAVKDSVKHIVGTQFRNTVTIGGSLYGRFGFSDLLSLFLVLDCKIKLYNKGIVDIDKFSKMPYDNDILESIIVYKTPLKICYTSFRNQATDFPVLTLALSKGDNVKVAVGARPARAELRVYTDDISDESFPQWVSSQFNYSDNMRASGEYREHLAEILAEKAVNIIGR